MKKYIKIIILFLCLSINQFACTCSWKGPFTDMILKSDVVVIGKVEKYILPNKLTNSSDAMIVKIEKRFKGKINKDTIIIFGDDGNSCSPYIEDYFKIGQKYYFALNNKNINEYYVSNCGEYWLQVIDNNYVSGVISNHDFKKIQKMKIDKVDEIIMDTLKK